MALAANDTLRLPCPERLDSPPTISCLDKVYESFYTPVTSRLLNYTSYEAIAAMQLMHDRNNCDVFPQGAPAGLSQLSHLPNQDDDLGGNDWINKMEEFSDTEDCHDSRQVLSQHYNEVLEAIYNSKLKETLETEFKNVMNAFIV